METTASEFFGSFVEEYDSLMRRAVPRYDEMISRVVEYVPAGRRRILELGCGTGNLTVAMAARFPAAEWTLVDASREMLAATAHRMDAGCVVRRIEARFEDFELRPAAFDLVTSCIALHHVVDKGELFRRVRATLEPGGAFVFCDQMRGTTDAHHQLNWDRMVDFWRLPGHLDEEEQPSLTEHAEAHDHYTNVIEHSHLLEAAGFRDVDCVWRNWMWGILSARA